MCDPCISPPDATDRMLLGWAAKVRHDHRMQEIQEMDIKAWAREQAGGRNE